MHVSTISGKAAEEAEYESHTKILTPVIWDIAGARYGPLQKNTKLLVLEQNRNIVTIKVNKLPCLLPSYLIVSSNNALCL
jgi:hypothetical protein